MHYLLIILLLNMCTVLL